MSDKEEHLDKWWRHYLSRSSTKITFAHLYFHELHRYAEKPVTSFKI